MSTAISSLSLAPQIVHPRSSEPLPSFICPITNDIMTDPVIDKHGHSFERKAIVEWLKTKSTCPMNQQPLISDDLAPNRALKETIESYQSQGSQALPRGADEKNVPQPHGQDQNDALAKPLLVGAQDLEKKGQLIDAEKLYLMALQFTSKSEDYAHLPRLFEKKGEKDRAASAYVVLADLQMHEGKQAETIATLKKSLELASHPAIKEKLGNILNNSGQKQEAAILFLELAQQALYNKDNLSAMRLCRLALEAFPGHAETWKTMAAMEHESSETLKMLIKGANEPSMPIKERIELCRMVSIKEPEHLQAKLLFLQLNQLKMKDKIKKLKLEVRGQLPSPAVEKKALVEPIKAVERTVPSMAFGKAKWEQYFGDIGVEPPLPPDIEQILNSPCPFWPGKKVRETHLLTLIPQTVNGQPLKLESLGELVQKPKQGHPTKYQYFNLGVYTDPPAPAAHWALLSRDVLPGSRSKAYADQQALVASFAQNTRTPYQVPTILDAAVSIFMEHVQSGARLYGDSPWTYTRCQEKYDANWQLVVGGFAPGGLSGVDFGANEGHGVGSLRLF
ncbi:MAG: U-box domain-containing protein [Verrucomicrobia bacterium]|nr:U-box domain-containing protein [Verrucomicrobiota bacterium]